MMRFLKNSVWDILLCTVLIFAAATTVYSGFYVPVDQIRQYAVTAGVAFALVLLLTIASYNKMSIVIGIIAFVLGFAGLIAAAVVSGSNLFADSEDNPFMRYLIIAVCAVIIFLLTRFRVGAVLLFPAGVIALCMTEFMYESRHLACLFLFLTASCMMVIYRNYMHNVLHSRTIKSAQFSAVFFALILSLLVAGAGSGIYYGIVTALNPQARELKLITKHLSLDVMERIGVTDIEVIEDPDLLTEEKDEMDETTQQEAEEEDEDLNGSTSEAEGDEGDSGSAMDRLNKILTGPFAAIRYDWGVPLWVIYTVLVILVIAAAITTKLLLRRRRYRKMLKQSPEERVKAMYLFYLKKFRQLKVRAIVGETPMEYAARNEKRLACFTAQGAQTVDFTELTRILVRTEYGGITPTLADTTQFETFYRRFYRNCREYLGRVQYIFKFFIL